MKPSKEFFEWLHDDEAFAKIIAEKAKEKIDGREKDYKAILIPLAAEYGYDVTGGELDKLAEKASDDISDEELGKIAGGTTPAIAVTATLTLLSIGYSVLATNSKVSQNSRIA